MNKHLKTLVGFKRGTTKIFTEQYYELWDASEEIWSGMKKIGLSVFVLLVWLFALCLIVVLPLATWLRLRWEKQHEDLIEKRKQEVFDSYTCLHQEDKDE